MATKKYYKVYYHGELLGEHTAVDIAAILKCAPGTIRTYASTGKMLYGEYTFGLITPEYKARKSWSMSQEMQEEWERTRRQLLHSRVDLGGIKLKPASGWR